MGIEDRERKDAQSGFRAKRTAFGKGLRSIPNPQSPILVIAALIAITVPGCSSTPSRPATSKPGGYYLDDGPGPNPPANLDSVPEPTPKVEPINRFTSRPYVVLGRAYTPYTQLTPYKARGVASWYGKRYHGQKTSSGEVYDMYAMTAAHTILPLPSYARVTNVANGKSVVVRVNDRGPFHEDRLIDLSYIAAQRLGLLGRGSGMVEVEAIIPGDEVAACCPRGGARARSRTCCRRIDGQRRVRRHLRAARRVLCGRECRRLPAQDAHRSGLAVRLDERLSQGRPLPGTCRTLFQP